MNKIIYILKYIKGYYMSFRSRRSWKYFWKHIDKENVYIESVHKTIFDDHLKTTEELENE